MKLYVTDLDGTLLTDIKGLDERDRERLVILLEEHQLPLTFATGRVIPSGMRALGYPYIMLPMIGHGGAVTQHPGGEVLHEERLETFEVIEGLAMLKGERLGLTTVLSAHNHHARYWWQPVGFTLMDKFIRSRNGDPTFNPLPDDFDFEKNPVVSLSCCGRENDFEGVKAWVASMPDLVMEIVRDPYVEEAQVGFIHRKGVSKGAALQRLMDRLGLGPEDVCVLGDAENDISMFQVAGRRIAPHSACAEILALADEVLPRGTSVLDFLELEARRLAAAR